MGAGTLWRRIRGVGAHRYAEGDGSSPGGRALEVLIVGSPNVGKSALFGALTRSYVTVSNYPGTTVEVYRARMTLEGREYEIVDTPGMYSLLPITEEERVARAVLLAERPHLVLHVADAKNLERLLPLTLQLIEAGLPVVLVLNMMDEAEARGVRVDLAGLEARLGVPVAGTVAASGRGIAALRQVIGHYDGSCS